MATALTSYNVSPNPNDSPGSAAVPVGSMMMWSTPTAPSQWLLCNGAAVSRNLYAALFSVLGTTYGVGDGSTTFNVPNLAGRVARGVNGSYALASSGGADGVDLKATDLPYHGHNVTEPEPTPGVFGHQHTLNNVAQNNQFFNGLAGTNRQAQIQSTQATTEYATTGILINASLRDGSNNPVLPGQRTLVDVRDPYLAVNYIIKAA
jgi:microcystin-dependent protein